MTRNYYEILGIEKNATEKQIKQVYRELSLKWHPDKNPGNKEAEENFKGISEAYRVLSDSETRKMYDIHGERWEDFLESADHVIFENNPKGKEILSQTKAIYSINNEFSLYWRVREEEISSDYHNWKEKVRSLEGDELESFRVKMINAIRNAGKEKKEKLLKREAIERINDILSRRDLEIGDLSLSNHNYEKEINNLLPQEIEKISSIEERLIKDAERIMLKRKEEQKVKEKETMKYSEYDVVGRQEKREGGSIIKKLVGKGIEGAKKAATYIHDSDRIPRSSEYQYPTIYSPESLVKSKETISSVQNLVWQQGVRSDHWWKEINKIVGKIDIFDTDAENKIVGINEDKVSSYSYWYNISFGNLKYLEKELEIDTVTPLRRINELKELDIEVKKVLGNPLPDDWKTKLVQLKNGLGIENQKLGQIQNQVERSEIISLEEKKAEQIDEFKKLESFDSVLNNVIESKERGGESLQKTKESLIKEIEKQQALYLSKLEKLKDKLKSKSKKPQKAKSKTIYFQTLLEEFLELQNLVASLENGNKQAVLDYLNKRQLQVKKLLEEKLFPSEFDELKEIHQIKERIDSLKIQIKDVGNRSLERSLSTSSKARSSVISERFSGVASTTEEKSLPTLPREKEKENVSQQEQFQTQVEQSSK